ncbi:Lrp/AsnC family transcriptional regulator [Ahrensia marina]|uniref:AsnC family transcriptional regulator n=1 Tax=Ahrensia marina TaxID=1514904 RepID=A0A0M9GLV1_9HYPH|nr:Lrp/AsnC family transcriptional regulator [Ahrensia marina]KPB00820.1 AsnC family transcriptional regulator [Ahrensia marina]
MDRTDKRILGLLGKNARMSFAALGREIGLSRTAVQDRVNRLETTGIIRSYDTNFSIHDAGMISALLFIKIAVRPCDQALEWLASLEDVHEVLSLSGEIDAVARCVVASTNDLTALNDKIGASQFIASSTSSLVLARR